jgi:5-hydroxyisourate hydrolase
MSAITTHILDLASGRPASGVSVKLESENGGTWKELGKSSTDSDGRVRDLLPSGEAIRPGAYRLTFETGAYWRAQGIESFYPFVSVTFVVSEGRSHYHVPLLVSPWGYSTYRGS